MTASEFEADPEGLRGEIQETRREMTGVIEAAPPDAFDLAPRGEWSVERVLRHVVQSEQLYAAVIRTLRGQSAPAGPPLPARFESDAEVLAALAGSRQLVREALEGVTEDQFYDLRQVGLNEESAKGILENLAMHDDEHAHQIRKTIGEVAK
jgi:uncharacterized damage-inducible protein DinB